METKNDDEQVSSRSGKSEERDDEEQKDRQLEEPVEQDPDQAGKDDDKASVGCASSLDFFFDEDETEIVTGTTEPAGDEICALEQPSAFMNTARNLPESSSAGKSKTT